MQTYQTAKVVILDKKKNVLLLRRSKTHPTEGLRYDLPGGIVEDNEETILALTREIFEETKLNVKPSDVRLVFTSTEERPEKVVFRFVYTTSLNEEKPTVKLSWEHDEAIWVAVSLASDRLIEGKYTQKGLIYALEHKLF